MIHRLLGLLRVGLLFLCHACHRSFLLAFRSNNLSFSCVLNGNKCAISILLDDTVFVQVTEHRLIVFLLGHYRTHVLELILHCIIFCNFSYYVLLLRQLSYPFILDLLFAFSTLGACLQQVAGSSFLYCNQKLIWVIICGRLATMEYLQEIVVLALKIRAISGSKLMFKFLSSASFLLRFFNTPSTHSWKGSPTSVYIKFAMYYRWSISTSLSTIGSAWNTIGCFFAHSRRSAVLRCSNYGMKMCFTSALLISFRFPDMMSRRCHTVIV